MTNRSVFAVSAFFTAAGISHFVKPHFYESLVPDWFPDAPAANRVSGAAEVVLGLAMIPTGTRPWAARGLLALLATVYPANIDAAINSVDVRADDGGVHRRHVGEVPDARNWIRLPFQFVMAAWVWRHTKRR